MFTMFTSLFPFLWSFLSPPTWIVYASHSNPGLFSMAWVSCPATWLPLHHFPPPENWTPRYLPPFGGPIGDPPHAFFVVFFIGKVWKKNRVLRRQPRCSGGEIQLSDFSCFVFQNIYNACAYVILGSAIGEVSCWIDAMPASYTRTLNSLRAFRYLHFQSNFFRAVHILAAPGRGRSGMRSIYKLCVD